MKISHVQLSTLNAQSYMRKLGQHRRHPINDTVTRLEQGDDIRITLEAWARHELVRSAWITRSRGCS
jgi:hypothetical protein